MSMNFILEKIKFFTFGLTKENLIITNWDKSL